MSNMRKCLITFLYMPKIGLETQGIDMCLNGYIEVFENVIQNTSWKWSFYFDDHFAWNYATSDVVLFCFFATFADWSTIIYDIHA